MSHADRIRKASIEKLMKRTLSLPTKKQLEREYDATLKRLSKVKR
jgi:hypothetical protein